MATKKVKNSTFIRCQKWTDTKLPIFFLHSPSIDLEQGARDKKRMKTEGKVRRFYNTAVSGTGGIVEENSA